MTTSYFKFGTPFVFNGIRYKVIRNIPPDGILAENLGTGEKQDFKIVELLKNMEKGNFSFEESTEIIQKESRMPIPTDFMTKKILMTNIKNILRMQILNMK